MAKTAIVNFTAAFLALSLLYIGGALTAVHVSADAAEARFYRLLEAGYPGRAVGHGERAIKLRAKRDGAEAERDMRLEIALADIHMDKGRFDRAAELYVEAIIELAANPLVTERRLAELTDSLGRAQLQSGRMLAGVEIYYGFLEAAGDFAAESIAGDPDTNIQAWYAEHVRGAAALFAEDLTDARVKTAHVGGLVASRIAVADKMAALGGFYAAEGRDLHTAAALLAAAQDVRLSILGPEHDDTLQTMLMLAPVYADLGQLGDAERLYLKVFHSQERRQGANNPDLSLYLKLLAGIYERQSRLTEAEALYEHIRSLFADAFGAQRYSANRSGERRSSIDRPVSPAFPVEQDYRPTDLVPAANYGIALSKPAAAEEMFIRLASDANDRTGFANMPARLAELMGLCEQQSGERLTLRSGFRSFGTQESLFDARGHAGKTAPAGASEHQTGLAVDIDVNGRFMRSGDRAHQCFRQNAFRFGFILSFPMGNSYLPGGSVFEPWHWRYVGPETARLYRETGPLDKPLEFLAALPCYQELAANGLSASVSGKDVCLVTELVETNS